ncbi:MAG: (2Fe-2S)-binding protein, partial [Anaerolineales bacterium]|nr:(2Fe-2S)-binding protein [Anaerolineales bacterium]
MMTHLTIDDKPIEMHEDRTLLEACREHGIHIPTLCYHPALEPYGACRLCIVEIFQPSRPSRLVTACDYPCEQGLVVKTNSESVQRSRRITAELLMAGAYNSPEIQTLAEELGVKEVRYRIPEDDNCVLCGLCVRACNEIVGISAISLTQRGMSKKVSTPFEISSSVCIGCGTCVLICPTGRLSLSDVTGYRSVHVSDSTYDRLYQMHDDTDLKPYFVQDIAGLFE